MKPVYTGFPSSSSIGSPFSSSSSPFSPIRSESMLNIIIPILLCYNLEKSYHRLKGSGYNFASQLIGITETQLLEIKQLGRDSVAEIIRTIKTLNFTTSLANKEISSDRAANEHGIGFVKRFKILSERYHNRRKRFGLRFNLIAGICNFDRKA